MAQKNIYSADQYMTAISNRAKALTEHWRERIEKSNEICRLRENRDMTDFEKVSIANQLQNVFEEFAGNTGITSLNETTIPDNLQTDLTYALDMVTAMMPSSNINDFATVFGIEQETARVFYYDTKANNAKGLISADETLVGANSGFNADGKNYSSAFIDYELLATGAQTSISTTLVYTPVVINDVNTYPMVLSYVYSGTAYEVKANASGVFTGTNITSGSVLADGTVAITFTSATDAGEDITISYGYNSQTTSTDYFPDINGELSYVDASATRDILGYQTLMDSGARFAKQMGVDLDKLLLTSLTNQVSEGLARRTADNIYSTATAVSTPTEVDLTPPNTSIPRALHYQDEVSDKLLEQSISIYESTNKSEANFVMTGRDLYKMMRRCPEDMFKRTGVAKGGGISNVGTFDDQFKVLYNPSWNSNQFLTGQKSDDILTVGYYFCPFIPLLISDLFHTKGTNQRREVVTWNAEMSVNSDFYAKGTVTES